MMLPVGGCPGRGEQLGGGLDADAALSDQFGATR